jgi:hypothetical protein
VCVCVSVWTVGADLTTPSPAAQGAASYQTGWQYRLAAQAGVASRLCSARLLSPSADATPAFQATG